MARDYSVPHTNSLIEEQKSPLWHKHYLPQFLPLNAQCLGFHKDSQDVRKHKEKQPMVKMHSHPYNQPDMKIIQML